jgi:hypothetical protein
VNKDPRPSTLGHVVFHTYFLQVMQIASGRVINAIELDETLKP